VRKFDTIYGTRSVQIQQTGTFRWEANDQGCRVIQRPGPGTATLPFSQHAYLGDTDAFAAPEAPGLIKVTSHDSADCDFELRSAVDGKILDFKTLHQGTSGLLDPFGATQVYLANVECDARVEAGRK
jgi:hypothetical protein